MFLPGGSVIFSTTSFALEGADVFRGVEVVAKTDDLPLVVEGPNVNSSSRYWPPVEVSASTMNSALIMVFYGDSLP